MGKVKRKVIQIISAVLTNANLKGFLEGRIYKGLPKKGCVPGLNCYSCPGAVGSCPIGSLQAVMGSAKYKFSFYIFGILILIGTLIGRLVCGFLCPFGLIQELLHKIPTPKIKLPKWTSYIKYAVLIIFVLLLPILWVNDIGMGNPTFCKYICPAGTLEGGIPLISTNPALQNSIGFLFKWKMTILILTIILAIISFRPFCKVICPLGAIYAIFNPISIYRYSIDEDKCTSCGKCARACKMDVEIYKKPNSMECIRCGECKDTCPTNAIKTVFKIK
ncbi:4Fe-4S binding protein [Clostridium ganghwense]|uniref:4Fe-4S binding protein n=1 Tax=Clostridium ganghwense TaxID=312089 RepID=A0ABT4CT51_9CLOT|nr:4Fe-4S binding protein [Clostridium ganghwense]MCY6372245.1 4Fe-4S binding protein [Clostridium ganghwense]